MTALRGWLWIGFGFTSLLVQCVEREMWWCDGGVGQTEMVQRELALRIEMRSITGCVPTGTLPGWAFARLLGMRSGMLDRWDRGQWIRAERVESGCVEVEIRSAGPDGEFMTSDDVVAHTGACDRCSR